MLVNYAFGGSTSVVSTARSVGLSFAPDTNRTPTFFVGKLHRKLAFREAISALHDVVVSDLRGRTTDRTAYKLWAAQQEARCKAEWASYQQSQRCFSACGATGREGARNNAACGHCTVTPMPACPEPR